MNGSAVRLYKYYSNLQTTMLVIEKANCSRKNKQMRSILPELAAIAQRTYDMNLKVVNII